MTNIEPVRALQHLRVLNISENRSIASLAPAELPELESLYFYGSTNVADGNLTPLLRMSGLKNVALQNRRHYSHSREHVEAALGGAQIPSC